jgi:cation/acetate symporter
VRAAAQVAQSAHQVLAVTLLAVFALGTLGLTVLARRHSRTATEFYTAGREFFPGQNGLALSGDYLSAASVLGIAGMISLVGYDGFLYSIGFLVAWVVVLLLIAEPLRNAGRFTTADALVLRLSERPVRAASSVATLTIVLFYLLAQMVGAGAVIALLLGTSGQGAKNWAIVVVGLLMIVYVTVGGMKGTTWVAMVKTAMLMVASVVLTAMVLARFAWNPSALLHAAAVGSGHGGAFLAPGLQFGDTLTSRLDLMSLGLALVLGTAGLPHVLMRIYTVPTARAARKSVIWATGITGAFYLMVLVLGFGAAALVGTATIRSSNAAGNTALPLLAHRLGGGFGSPGGRIMLAAVCAVAFATILAVVAALTLAASSSFAHDLYASVIRKGQATEREELRAARVSAVFIGAAAMLLSISAQKLNVAFLVALAFAVAASGNLPTLLYAIYWRRFTTRGAVWATYSGLAASVLLVVFSPVVSGTPQALLPGVDFHLVPLQNPGIVSIPVGFLAGWLGTMLTRPPEDGGHAEETAYARMEVRSLTGAGSY